MKAMLFLLGVSAVLFGSGCQTSSGTVKNQDSGIDKQNSERKAILVVSFGTTYRDTLAKTIEACEKEIALAFPDYHVRRAFTSHIVIKRLKERDNLAIDKPEEALKRLYTEGFSEVIVQPLHIIPGEEFHEKVLAHVAEYKGKFKKIAVGRPLLTYHEDYKKAIDAFMASSTSSSGKALVFMGHGTHHPADAAYAYLQGICDREKLPVYIGTVEGFPGLEEVIVRLKRDGIREVVLIPFMLVAGDHANNDMAGDEEDSWKTVLTKAGFTVEPRVEGLGENPHIRALYVEHVRDAITDKVPGGEEKE